MEENLEVLKLLESRVSDEELKRLSPVTLAWVGDGVYSHFIRKYLVQNRGTARIDRLNRESIDYVEAGAQSKIVHQLLKTELSETERDVVRRGRNTKSHVPKNASVNDYRYATGFEALLGWHALRGDWDRVKDICAMAITIINS